MAKLGKGLAALIPSRGSVDEDEETEAASDMLDQLDAMPDQKIEQQEEQEERITETPVESSAVHSKTKTTQLNVIEDIDELEEEDGLELPSAPNVTPLTIDAKTGQVAKQAEEKVEKEVEEEAVAEKVIKKEEPAEKVQAINDNRVLEKEVYNIPIGDIEVNPLQPRRQFQQTELDELSDSLRQHGMLQPMVVMRKDDGRGYQIIAGERRWRASKQLEWDTVPCVIRENVWGDRNRLELALTENVQRENLNPVEEAEGYKILHDEYGMTHDEIAERVGKGRVSVTNFLRLLQLPAEIQRGLSEGKITVGHAKAILMIPDEAKQLRFYQHVVAEGLTVRKAETRARNIQHTMNIDDPLRQKNRGRPALALKYDNQLQEHFDNNVRVKFNSTKNRFEVVFVAHSQNEAEGLIGKLLATDVPADEAIEEQLDD